MSVYRRILVKISGEALTGSASFGFDNATLDQISSDILLIYRSGIEIGIVVGGGNICRGNNVKEIGVDRPTGDYMGMLATTINALALQSKFQSMGIKASIQSAIKMDSICEQYNRARAKEHLSSGEVVIFCGGTGHPFFTTDTAAVLRAIEVDCDLMIKYTKVDGVYCSDPMKNQDAQHLPKVSYDEIIRNNLRVMDITAIALAKENNLKIAICKIHNKILQYIISGVSEDECGFTIIS